MPPWSSRLVVRWTRWFSGMSFRFFLCFTRIYSPRNNFACPASLGFVCYKCPFYKLLFCLNQTRISCIAHNEKLQPIFVDPSVLLRQNLWGKGPLIRIFGSTLGDTCWNLKATAIVGIWDTSSADVFWVHVCLVVWTPGPTPCCQLHWAVFRGWTHVSGVHRTGDQLSRALLPSLLPMAIHHNHIC